MKVAIIGAGPAGVYTALHLKSFDGEVHLFEQNKDIGEKLKTTGGGRMNVTNKVFSDYEFSSDTKRFVERMFKNNHFEDRYEILKELGIEYDWEKNRAILQSQDAVLEVARLKERILEQKNITLHLDTKITSIKAEGSDFFITHKSKTERYDKIVLSTGGMYRMFDLAPKDEIYKLQTDIGHSITDVTPSLCPLLFPDKPLRALSGISFVGTLTDKNTQRSITDDLLITHFGISGPGSLDFSSFAGEKVSLSFISNITEKEFITQFNNARQGKHSLKKFLKPFMPQRLALFHIERSGISQDFIADIPKTELKALADSVFHYPIPPRKNNIYPGSWTTKGGVSLNEVQTKNLESKKTPGIYFTGEVLDFNGLCGGYNISFAMISGKIVADDILNA